jgi:cell wall-associated NlpC family hydrolase
MSWTDAYINIPFLYDGRDKNGLDCWGLVWAVYVDQLGIILPDYKGMFTDGSLPTLLRRAKLMDAEREKWERRSQYESPQPFDVILLRTKGVPSHVGVVIDSRRMLHITEGINSCVEDYTGLMWKDRVIGFYWRAHE